MFVFSPDGSGIFLFWCSEQKIERTAGAMFLENAKLWCFIKQKKAPVVELMLLSMIEKNIIFSFLLQDLLLLLLLLPELLS